MLPKIPEIKRYRFCGITYVQKELTIGEDIEVGPLVQPLFGFKASTMEEWLVAAIGIIGDDQNFEKIFSILLKPYEPTLWHRWRNSYYAWRHGIALHSRSGTHIVKLLHASEVAEVLLDFFIFSAAWMTILPLSGMKSDFQMEDTAPKSPTPETPEP